MAWFNQVQGVVFNITNDSPNELLDNIESDERFKALRDRVEESKFSIGTNPNADEGYLVVFVGKTTLADRNVYIGKTVVARLATNEEMAAALAYGAELETILADYGAATRREGFILAQWN